MEINGKDLKYFDVKILEFTYQPISVSTNIVNTENGLRPMQGSLKLSPKQITLKLEFGSKVCISDFIAELCEHDENLLDIDDGFLYHCYAQDIGDCVNEIARDWYEVSIPMLVIQTDFIKKISITSASYNFEVLGNVKADAIYEVTASSDIDTVTIDNYTIKNLKANDTFVLDGIDKLIYRKSASDVSAFDDTDLMGFPKLSPGQHLYTCDNNEVSTVIKYYPTYM